MFYQNSILILSSIKIRRKNLLGCLIFLIKMEGGLFLWTRSKTFWGTIFKFILFVSTKSSRGLFDLSGHHMENEELEVLSKDIMETLDEDGDGDISKEGKYRYLSTNNTCFVVCTLQNSSNTLWKGKASLERTMLQFYASLNFYWMKQHFLSPIA